MGESTSDRGPTIFTRWATVRYHHRPHSCSYLGARMKAKRFYRGTAKRVLGLVMPRALVHISTPSAITEIQPNVNIVTTKMRLVRMPR
eukprot:scaffold173882_cov32-Tisochrysis_lutea.AAC.1